MAPRIAFPFGTLAGIDATGVCLLASLCAFGVALILWLRDRGHL